MPAAAGERLDNGLFWVVDQQKNVGQLNGRIPADVHPGRDPFQHRALGGSDESGSAGGEIILLQVHHAHQAVADGAVGLGPLQIHHGTGQGLEHALVQIAVHGVIDGFDVGLQAAVMELSLGQNKAQSGGCLAHGLLHPLPVLRLRCELVAGHHGPLGQVNAACRQQNVGRRKDRCLGIYMHGNSFFFKNCNGTVSLYRLLVPKR